MQEAQQTQRSLPRHIIIKPLQAEDSKKNFEHNKEKKILEQNSNC